MIPQTEVVVEPGKMTFMGKIAVKSATGMKNADPTQTHYHEFVKSGPKKSNAGAGIGSDSAYIAIEYAHKNVKAKLKSISKGAATESEFWTKTES